MSLEGKIALVTGASRGLGAAIAIGLAQRGAIVAGTATQQAGADDITKALGEQGLNGQGFIMDVTQPDSISNCLSEINITYGAPLILVNNAGITQDNILLRMREDEWGSVIETDLNAIYRVTKLCLKAMVKARWGRVISISSVAGVAGSIGQSNYAAAKAGIIGFSKSVAQEIASRNITVNVVAPGLIDTDMAQALTQEQRQTILDQIPMGQLGRPEDIANAVAFLAGNEASYITGATLHVNGGMHMA